MFDKIIDYFVTEPRRLTELGAVLWHLGAGIIFIGFFGNVITVATSAVESLASHEAHAKTLAEMFPSFSTWWIPESVIGGIPAACVCGLGLWFQLAGKRIQLILKH